MYVHSVDACPVEFREAMRHAQSRINDLYPVMSQAGVPKKAPHNPG